MQTTFYSEDLELEFAVKVCNLQITSLLTTVDRTLHVSSPCHPFNTGLKLRTLQYHWNTSYRVSERHRRARDAKHESTIYSASLNRKAALLWTHPTSRYCNSSELPPTSIACPKSERLMSNCIQSSVASQVAMLNLAKRSESQSFGSCEKKSD